MTQFADELEKLAIANQWLIGILQGDEEHTETVNGLVKPSITKSIADHFSLLRSLVNGTRAFLLKSEMDATAWSSDELKLARVVNDPVTSNNGLYYWKEPDNVWTKTIYDPISYIDDLIQDIPSASTAAPWFDVDVILNDYTGEHTKDITGAGTAVVAPATWGASAQVVEVTSVAGESTATTWNFRYLSKNLSDYAGQYLDVVIAADLGSLSRTEENSDFSSFGLFLTNATFVQCYEYRTLNDSVKEYRATVAVDDILATNPTASLFDMRVYFASAAAGTIRFGLPRVAFGSTNDRSAFDHAYSRVVNNALSVSLPAAYDDVDVVFSDDDVSSTTVTAGTSAVVEASPAHWPAGVSAHATDLSSNDSVVQISRSLRGIDGGGDIIVSDHDGEYLYFQCLIETDRVFDRDTFRSGLLLVSDSGYPKVDVDRIEHVSGHVYLASGIAYVDDLVSGHANARLEAYSPQFKSNVDGSFKFGRLIVAFTNHTRREAIQQSIIGQLHYATTASVTQASSDAANALSVAQAAQSAVSAAGLNIHKSRLKTCITTKRDDVFAVDASLATVSIVGDTTSITNPRIVANTDERLRYLFGRDEVAGSTWPLNQQRKTVSVTQSENGGTANNVWGLEFDLYGDAVEIGVNKNTSARSVYVYVDGVLVNESGLELQSGTNSQHVIRIAFTSRARRRIRLVSNLVNVWSVYHAQGSLIYKSNNTRSCLGVIAGDSFTEGANSTVVINKYAYKLGQLLGVDNAVVSGLGGTGYLKKIAHHDGSQRLNLLERISDLHNPLGDNTAPDFVVIAMGINDGSLADSSVASNARACFDAIRAELSDTPIFVVAPFYTTENNYDADLATAIRSEVDAVSECYFIDTDGWVTGTGKATSLQNDGISDWVRDDDDTHPTDAGHDYYAHRIANAIEQVVTGF